jgi:hypothetical protein
MCWSLPRRPVCVGPPLYDGYRARVETDRASAVALAAQDTDRAAGPVDVGNLQRQHLGVPKAAAVPRKPGGGRPV